MGQLTGRPRRMFGLVYGWEPVTEALSLRGGSPDVFLLEPVTGAAVEFDQGWVLFDTGFNVDTIRDPVKRVAHYANLDPYYCYLGCIPRGDPLMRQVEAAGLKWPDLAMVVISHLHCDHSGGLPHLVDGPSIVLQKVEHAFAMGEAGLEHAFFRTDYELPGLRWHLVDGDTELADGLRVMATPGHTPGHMSLAVDLPKAGTVVLAGDCADLKRNIEEQIPCGSTTHPRLVVDAERSIARMHQLHRDGIDVWPSHDPDFWATRRRPPDAYE